MQGFLESVASRHPEDQKVPSVQFVVSKPCHKFSSHAVLGPTASQTCSQSTTGSSSTCQWPGPILPLLPGDSSTAPVTLGAAPGCWPGTLSSFSCSELLWLGSCDPAVLSDTPWLCQSSSAGVSFPCSLGSELCAEHGVQSADATGKAGWGSPSTTQGSPLSPAACLEAREETSNP